MALGTVSVCLTVFTLNLHHRDAENQVPRWAKILILHYMAKMLCVGARQPKTMADKRTFMRKSCDFDGPINLRGGIRKMARDMQILRPMLNSSSIGNSVSHMNNVSQNDIKGYSSTDSYTTPQEKRNSCKCNPHCNGKVNENSHRTEGYNDWKEVAHVLDRLFFYIALVCMSGSTWLILAVPFYKEEKS